MEDHLYSMVSDSVGKNLTQEKLLVILVRMKFKSLGIELTKKQTQGIRLHFEKYGSNGLENLSINFTRAQTSYLKRTGQTNLILDFEQSDIDKLDKEIQDISNIAIQKIAEGLSDNLLKEWKKQSKGLLKKINTQRKTFNSFHNKVWGKPLDLLESLIDISLETGDKFNGKIQSVAVHENNLVFDVVLRLHARGCQVGSEILTLLHHGFADGAHARWRTLHELSVLARFIADNDNKLAERYLDHIAVSEYRNALTYREYSEQLSYAPMSDEIFNKIKSNRDMVIAKYEKNSDYFKNDYWWAMDVLGKSNPNFSHIEDKIEIKFMRPFVKLAHINIHADPRGMMIRLGTPPNNPDLLLAGASIFGIAEPAQNTAYSMSLLTSSLFSIYKSFDNISFIYAYKKLTDEVVWLFDQVASSQEANLQQHSANYI